MRIYWIKELGRGSLGMMARPKGGDWLESEVDKLKEQEVDLVIALLESGEIFDLGLEQEEAFCRAKGIDFVNYAIPDRGLPKNSDSFLALVNEVVDRLKLGSKVVVHCRMGIGRTGLLAGAVLVNLKPEVADVFAYLSEARTLRMPDTSEQVDWVSKLRPDLEQL